MSFGFSVGDFIAGASLIKGIISALNGAAELEYRELELELHGLERALGELEHLVPEEGQEDAVNSVKAAALMCRSPLEEFYEKLKQYRCLTRPGAKNKSEVVRGWGKKVQWSLSMSDEVQRLRSYVAAHVGSLNMRLLTIGLTSMGAVKQCSVKQNAELFARLTQQALSTAQNSAQSNLIYKHIVQTVVPLLQNIDVFAREALFSNLQVLAQITNMKSTQVDLTHTWFQRPFRLEDAFGRIIPIPVEYGWLVSTNYQADI